jgi:hypothetical protein
MTELFRNAEGPMEGAAAARRDFLAKCGKFAVVTPPAVSLLLSTSLNSAAIASSGGGEGGGGGGGGGGGEEPPVELNKRQLKIQRRISRLQARLANANPAAQARIQQRILSLQARL